MKIIYTQLIDHAIQLDKSPRIHSMHKPLELAVSNSVDELESLSRQYILNTMSDIEKIKGKDVNYKSLFKNNNLFLAQVDDGEYVFGWEIVERPKNLLKLNYRLYRPITEDLKFSLVIMEKTNSKSLKDLIKQEKISRLIYSENE